MDCLERPTSYLRSAECKTKHLSLRGDDLMKSLNVVMRNYCMRFKDSIILQVIGIPKGILPGSSIANLYVAISKASNILPLRNVCLFYLCRFIDGSFGV
ncbi:hypothetical protein ACHAWF_011413 [Thalassiosira exigua]